MFITHCCLSCLSPWLKDHLCSLYLHYDNYQCWLISSIFICISTSSLNGDFADVTTYDNIPTIKLNVTKLFRSVTYTGVLFLMMYWSIFNIFFSDLTVCSFCKLHIVTVHSPLDSWRHPSVKERSSNMLTNHIFHMAF